MKYRDESLLSKSKECVNYYNAKKKWTIDDLNNNLRSNRAVPVVSRKAQLKIHSRTLI